MEKKDELKNDKSLEEKSELIKKERITILLEEYRNAQSSAQHHDTLVWTVTSIFWAANILLFRVVIDSIEKNNLKGLPIALSLLGLFLCLSVWEFSRQFNDIMRQKYSRCKVIEGELGMEQHCKLSYSSGVQKMIYSFIMSLFIVLWGMILSIVCTC